MRREDCRGGFRPCPLVSCRYHLFWELYPPIRRIQPVNVLDIEDDEDAVKFIERMEHSCVLDLQEKHGQMTLEEVGGVFEVTRERIRQVQQMAIKNGTIIVKREKLRAIREGRPSPVFDIVELLKTVGEYL